MKSLRSKLARALRDTAIRLQRWANRLERPRTFLDRKYPTQEDFATIPDEPKGHVVTAAKRDKPWRPGQSGGVITAEPDAVTLGRERGEDVGDTRAS